MMDEISRQKSGFPFFAVILTIVLTLLIAGGVAYFLGYLGPRGTGGKTMVQSASTSSSTRAGSSPAAGKRKILYWRAPMNPMEIYHHPGKSAMGMKLVPVYADQTANGPEIKINPVIEQDMGVRTAVVKKGPLSHTIRAYGRVTYDESKVTMINPRYSGWIEKLYVDFTGQMVKKGDPLFTIYSPELITVQQDYLSAYRNYRHNPDRTNKQTLASVRRRLHYYDIGDMDIRAIEKKGSALHALTIRSPFSGVVVKKDAFEGRHIKAGSMVYEIAGLSHVWVNAHIYSYELAGVKAGMPVRVTLPYLPGKHYEGKIAYLYPYVEQQTRDVVARIDLANPDLTLRPNMYANVYIQTGVGQFGIQIPNEAVIRTGLRNVVFLALPDHTFALQKVTLGMPLDDGMIQILKGLTPGQIVVTSGEFLLSSESNLREAAQKMMNIKNGGAGSTAGGAMPGMEPGRTKQQKPPMDMGNAGKKTNKK